MTDATSAACEEESSPVGQSVGRMRLGAADKESAPDPPSEPLEAFPMIRRSYRPATDLDERLKRVFALLSIAPRAEVDEKPKRWVGG